MEPEDGFHFDEAVRRRHQEIVRASVARGALRLRGTYLQVLQRLSKVLVTGVPSGAKM